MNIFVVHGFPPYVTYGLGCLWQILKSSICNIPHMRATWLNLLRADVILQIFPFWQSGIPNPSCR